MDPKANYYTYLFYSGTKDILFQLRFFPKRYNQLKTELKHAVSSRTLDLRLKELTLGGVITKNELVLIKPPTHEYSLTKIGMILESIIFSLTKLSNVTTDDHSDQFLNIFHYHYSLIKTYNWSSIWYFLLNIFQQKIPIKTLAQQKENVIKEFTNEKILISTDRNDTWLEVEKIRQVWSFLLQEQTLPRDDYDKSTYRSSFIFGLLSLLDCVEIIPGRPITLRLKNKLDCEIFPPKFP